MGKEIRILRYSREYAEQAVNLLYELKQIIGDYEVAEKDLERLYRNSLVHGVDIVPLKYIRLYDKLMVLQKKRINKHDEVVKNLTMSLSFCSELVAWMIEDETGEAKNYKVRTRRVIDRVISIATDNAINQNKLAPLTVPIAKMESIILLHEDNDLILIRRSLLEFRNQIMSLFPS